MASIAELGKGMFESRDSAWEELEPEWCSNWCTMDLAESLPGVLRHWCLYVCALLTRGRACKALSWRPDTENVVTGFLNSFERMPISPITWVALFHRSCHCSPMLTVRL